MQNEGSGISVGLPSGTVIWNRYRLDQPIGMGGFGITYKGYDMESGMVVAVKEYFPLGVVTRNSNGSVIVMGMENEADFQHGVDRFLREARDVTRFYDNPNIVKVHNFFKENGTAYMVMEFLEGCTLKEYIERNGGRIDYAMAIQVIFSMMETLEQVHEVGMVHRDISPDNIYICRDSSIRLIDFGAAKITTERDNRSASVVLKQGYAPMEQYSSKGNIGPWTDVYAFGALMYFMLTGVRPSESVYRMYDDDVVPPEQLNPNITPDISRVIMKALQMRIEDRYQNMSEMRSDLLRKEEQPQPQPQPQEPAARGNSEILTASMRGNSEVLTASMRGNSEVLTASMRGNSQVLTASMQRTGYPDGQAENTGMASGHKKRRTGILILTGIAVAVVIAVVIIFAVK
ncbi:MAG: serine/threonine protein kinase [Eubacterium sp.]|nr:serine/threonine protein kinase [Eubacterium sp.]